MTYGQFVVCMLGAACITCAMACTAVREELRLKREGARRRTIDQLMGRRE